MKRIITSIITASVLALLCGCEKRECVPDVSATGSLSVAVDGFDVGLTKATEANQGKEGVLNSVQLLLFNNNMMSETDDALVRYHSCTAGEISAGTVTLTDISEGAYYVDVVANGPDLSSVTSRVSLGAMTTTLGEYNATASGFLMTGTESVSVSENAEASVSVTLAHPVSRVKVSEITNSMPSSLGTLTVKSIMLTNVYGAWLLMGGKPSTAVWYNQEGRKDEDPRVSSHIIDGTTYESSCPDLLWRSINQNVAVGSSYTTTQYLYAFPNDATTAPDGFKQPFNAQRTCVVLTAAVGSQTYYYPVVLDGKLESNKSYDVQYDITGYGSDDPNTPVTNGTMTATVTVNDWDGTKTYTDNI